VDWLDANGEYVLHSDHEAEVARLRAELADAHAAIESKAGWEWKKEADRLRTELQNAAKAALDAVALSCEKEREADALRVDAMRYRWLRDQAPWSDSKNPCPYSEQEDGQLRCITAGLDEQIDAAMGASA